MYRDDYPSLFTHYSKTNPTLNFEAIMAAMQEHFGDVFQLGVLETIFKKKEEASARAARTPKGSYETFFDACMDGLKKRWFERFTHCYRTMTRRFTIC